MECPQRPGNNVLCSLYVNSLAYCRIIINLFLNFLKLTDAQKGIKKQYARTRNRPDGH